MLFKKSVLDSRWLTNRNKATLETNFLQVGLLKTLPNPLALLLWVLKPNKTF